MKKLLAILLMLAFSASAQTVVSGTGIIIKGGDAKNSPLGAPSPWRWLGDGTEGAYSCPSGTCYLGGEHWYTTVNIALNAILANNYSSSIPLVIRATGTCTVAGTISVSANTGATGSYGAATFGGSGGGGGGGTGAGSAGYLIAYYPAGTAGGAGGGAGSNGIQQSAQIFKLFLSVGHPGMTVAATVPLGGSGGGAGGSSGPTGGPGGMYLALICNAINFTGTLDASGVNGANSTGNNVGASGGGGGGVIITSAQSYIANSGTINVTGGSGGSCLSYLGCGAGGNGASGNSAQFTIQ